MMKYERVPPNTTTSRRMRKRVIVTAFLLATIEEETEINMHTLREMVKKTTRYELHSNVIGHYLIRAVKDGIVHRKHKRVGYQMQVIYCWGPETGEDEEETPENGSTVK